jgi:hypothetical protein
MSNLNTIITELENTINFLKEINDDKDFMNIINKYNEKSKAKTLSNIIDSDTNNIIESLELNKTDELVNSDENNNQIYHDEEQWKDIVNSGVNFNYQISSHGRVRNKSDNYILSQNLRDGYKSIGITYFDNEKSIRKFFKIHRLVAIAFVNNPDPVNNNVANHIDGNKFNNHWTNFEWTTIKENNQHAINTGLNKITKRRVIQLDMSDNQIGIFESLDAASKATGVDDGGITKVCKGYRKTAGGFKWKYADINPNEQNLNDEDLEGFIPIKDFPNYLIDRAGRVYSKSYKKFLKTIKTRDNSQELQLANNGVRKTYLLHNLMADHFLEKIEGKDSIAHINRDKSDNRVENLKRVSHSELCKMALNHKTKQLDIMDV